MNGKWTLGEETTAYESEDFVMTKIEATLPDKSKRELHYLRNGAGTVGTVVHDPARGVLLVWTHQLPDDEWGWQLPGGVVKEKEKAKDVAAARVEAVTGWKPGKLEPLLTCLPAPGFLDHSFNAFVADGATWSGPGPDANEVSDLTWLPIEGVREQIAKGTVTDGLTLTALLYVLNSGRLS